MWSITYFLLVWRIQRTYMSAHCFILLHQKINRDKLLLKYDRNISKGAKAGEEGVWYKKKYIKQERTFTLWREKLCLVKKRHRHESWVRWIPLTSLNMNLWFSGLYLTSMPDELLLCTFLKASSIFSTCEKQFVVKHFWVWQTLYWWRTTFIVQYIHNI